MTLNFLFTVLYDVDLYDNNGQYLSTENKRVIISSGISNWDVINANLDVAETTTRRR